jgi:glycosyltransferase involved in cell wall biosynthesis
LRVLILYTELAGYVLGNINLFLKNNPTAELALIHYPVNPEAPFKIDDLPRTTLLEYNQLNQVKILDLVLEFKPDLVLCSGWGNKFYLKLMDIVPDYSKKVVCFDNKWKSTFKQYILVFFSKFFILNKFSFAWVPGNPQKRYALKLGFKIDNIYTGLYPADSSFFLKVGNKKLGNEGPYPKVILSVARYIVQKDLPTLWRAFINANSKTGNQWVLKSIGLGDQFDSRIEDKFIEHLGFKQPSEMEEYILTSGIYVLPSIEEPWGVAVHEMALSALPLVLSEKVGAASMFLKVDNGFSFPAGNQDKLEEILVNIMRMDDSQLKEMSRASLKSGQQLLSQDWSKTLLEIYNS